MTRSTTVWFIEMGEKGHFETLYREGVTRENVRATKGTNGTRVLFFQRTIPIKNTSRECCIEACSKASVKEIGSFADIAIKGNI